MCKLYQKLKKDLIFLNIKLEDVLNYMYKSKKKTNCIVMASIKEEKNGEELTVYLSLAKRKLNRTFIPLALVGNKMVESQRGGWGIIKSLY